MDVSAERRTNFRGCDLKPWRTSAAAAFDRSHLGDLFTRHRTSNGSHPDWHST